MTILVPVLDEQGRIIGDMPVEAPDGTLPGDSRYFPDYSKRPELSLGISDEPTPVTKQNPRKRRVRGKKWRQR